MSLNGLQAPVSGLQTNAFRVAVSANNVANVNTDGFKASGVATSDRAYINDIGQGTQVASTYTDPRPGPVVQSAAGGPTEGSNTDPIAEMTGQMGARAAYGANLATARTLDDMSRTVLDLKR